MDKPLRPFFHIFYGQEPWGWPAINNECGHSALWTIAFILAESAESPV